MTSPRLEEEKTTASDKPAEVPIEKSAGNILETFIKLVGLAGAVSASMGLPAVFLHFKHLGIPSYYIDYQIILSAGVFPVIILALIALYFRAVLRHSKKDVQALPLYAALLIPFILPIFPFLIFGAIALLLIYCWGISWLLLLPLKWLGLFSFDNRETFYVAVGLFFLASTLYSLRNYLLKIAFIQKLISIFRIKALRHLDKKGFRQSGTQATDPTTRKHIDKSKEQEAKEWLPLLPFLWIGIPAMFIGLLFAIKGLLYVWDPHLAEILSTEMILWSGTGLGFMYGIMMSSLAWIQFLQLDSQRMKIIGLSIVAGTLLIGGVFLVSLYTIKIYPSLNQAWGGGRPESVIVWFKQEELPLIDAIHSRLPDVNVTKEGQFVRIGPTLTLSVGKQMILLNRSQTTEKAIVLPLENVKMVTRDGEK